jgi:hypothetical protein
LESYLNETNVKSLIIAKPNDLSPIIGLFSDSAPAHVDPSFLGRIGAAWLLDLRFGAGWLDDVANAPTGAVPSDPAATEVDAAADHLHDALDPAAELQVRGTYSTHCAATAVHRTACTHGHAGDEVFYGNEKNQSSLVRWCLRRWPMGNGERECRGQGRKGKKHAAQVWWMIPDEGIKRHVVFVFFFLFW